MASKFFYLLFSFIQRFLYKYSFYEWLTEKFNLIRSYWLFPMFFQCSRTVRFCRIGKIKGSQYIKIGDYTYFSDYIHLTAWDEYLIVDNDSNNLKKQVLTPSIIIGDKCNFGAWNHITSAFGITIGNNCLTGKWVTISDNNHGNIDDLTTNIPPIRRKLCTKGKIIIGDNVWIGEKSTILSGVIIGNNVTIAANSVVTKNVPDNCVVAGIPAKIINRLR